MYTRAMLLFNAIVFCSTLFAQNITGVWEGSFLLHENKKQKMNVRLELIESDGEYIGVLYSRGYDRNTSFGCDYIVAGRVANGRICLNVKEVKRGVAMSKTDCAYFKELCLSIPKGNSVKKLAGSWCWRTQECDDFTASQTDTIISELSKDEIDNYVQELYEGFEKNQVVLQPENRLYQKVAQLEVDSSDILLEFNSAGNNQHDTISVFFNGDLIAEQHDLSKRPLKIRLKELPTGSSDIIVISQSVAQNKLNIRLTVNHQQQSHVYILEPGHIRNSLLIFKRKEN